jgi:multiple sugar transport system permease protein/raffinose/stachyose/melibiose transport system permease protein
MIFLPITLSAIIVAILWNRIIFSPSGVLVTMMRSLTGNQRWLLSIAEDKFWAIFPVLFVILWMYTGLYMIIFLANMQKIPQSTLEAALLDGANEWQILRKVVVPNLVGVILTCTIFAIAGSLKSFDLIFAMTSGGPARYTEILSLYMYKYAFQTTVNPFGMGAASSMVMILLSVVLIVVAQRGFRYFEHKYE